MVVKLPSLWCTISVSKKDSLPSHSLSTVKLIDGLIEFSFCSTSSITNALYTGTLVNNEITSNDTSCIPIGKSSCLTKFENSNELSTCELVFPTKGDKIVTKCLP